MNKKYNKYSQYLVTIIVCSIIVLVVCMIVELALMFKCENYITHNELNMANLVKFATMEQLEKRLNREPENYVVMVRLAQINEELNNKSAANKLYEKALKFSARSTYVIYNYALFCAKNNLYALSSALAEEIISKNKKTIRYKSEIYETIADNLEKNNEYDGAVRAYQVSFKYAKNVNNKNYLNRITNKYSTAYIKLADSLIEQNMVSEAISALNNSLKIKENALAKYKLSLIFLDVNKIRAQKLMEEVFIEEPYLINPYIYNSLLNELINNAKNSNDRSALNYYSVKYSRFKKSMGDIYLYKDDISIENSYIKTEKDNHYLVFTIKNNNKYKIDQLYLDVELFLNTKRYTVSKKVASLSNTLGAYEEFKNFEIKLPSNIEFVDVADHNYLILKYFAKKSVKAPNTLVKIDSLNF